MPVDAYFLNQKSIYCPDTGETIIGYKNYLKSPHWLQLRARMIKPDTVCSHCQEKKPVLQLQHLHYKTIGREDAANDLLVLCEDCHKLIHKANYNPKPTSKPNKGKKSNGKKQEKNKVKMPKGEMRYNSRLERIESISEGMYRNIYKSVMKLDKQHMTLLRDALNDRLA